MRGEREPPSSLFFIRLQLNCSPTSLTAFISGLSEAQSWWYIYTGGGVAGALVLMTAAVLFMRRNRYVIAGPVSFRKMIQTASHVAT